MAESVFRFLVLPLIILAVWLCIRLSSSGCSHRHRGKRISYAYVSHGWICTRLSDGSEGVCHCLNRGERLDGWDDRHVYYTDADGVRWRF